MHTKDTNKQLQEGFSSPDHKETRALEAKADLLEVGMLDYWRQTHKGREAIIDAAVFDLAYIIALLTSQSRIDREKGKTRTRDLVKQGEFLRNVKKQAERE